MFTPTGHICPVLIFVLLDVLGWWLSWRRTCGAAVREKIGVVNLQSRAYSRGSVNKDRDSDCGKAGFSYVISLLDNLSHMLDASEYDFLSADTLESLTVDGHVKKGKYVSSHLHLNVTYLLEADFEEAVSIKADENSGVAWFSPEEALKKSTEPWFVEHVYSKLIEKM